MPALEAFAKEATVFRDASSCASWTAPAVASLVTGLLPSKHGVQGVHDAPPIPSSVPTVAEAFHAAGWWTGAWTAGGWVGRSQGFARGFDRFEETFDKEGAKAAVAAFGKDRPAGKPFFLFLHTYAAHDPYGDKAPVSPDSPDVPAALREEAKRLAEKVAASRDGRLPWDDVGALMSAYLSDATARAVFGREMQRRDYAALWAQCLEWVDGRYFEVRDPRGTEERLRAAYWKGVEYADGVVDATLKALGALGLPEGTAIVVVSDHGEAFGEHGILGHGRRLHEELIRVPLLLSAPGRTARGVVPGSCSVLDVVPTLLELGGVSAARPADGVSLLPLAAGKAKDRAVLAESDPDGTREGKRTPTKERSVRTERTKGVVTIDARTGKTISTSVFDLRSDPQERTPAPSPPEGKDPEFIRAWQALLLTLRGH